MRSRKRVNLDEAYRRYKRDYRIRERRMKNRGFTMDTRMLSKDDFSVSYNAYKNDMEDYAINMGSRKPTAQQIIDTIVSDQSFDISIRQARAYKEALEYATEDWDSEWPTWDGEERVPLTLSNIRKGFFGERLFDENGEDIGFSGPMGDIFDMIRAYRKRRFEEGATPEDVRDEVRSTFFGSK